MAQALDARMVELAEHEPDIQATVLAVNRIEQQDGAYARSLVFSGVQKLRLNDSYYLYEGMRRSGKDIIRAAIRDVGGHEVAGSITEVRYLGRKSGGQGPSSVMVTFSSADNKRHFLSYLGQHQQSYGRESMMEGILIRDAFPERKMAEVRQLLRDGQRAKEAGVVDAYRVINTGLQSRPVLEGRKGGADGGRRLWARLREGDIPEDVRREQGAERTGTVGQQAAGQQAEGRKAESRRQPEGRPVEGQQAVGSSTRKGTVSPPAMIAKPDMRDRNRRRKEEKGRKRERRAAEAAQSGGSRRVEEVPSSDDNLTPVNTPTKATRRRRVRAATVHSSSSEEDSSSSSSDESVCEVASRRLDMEEVGEAEQEREEIAQFTRSIALQQEYEESMDGRDSQEGGGSDT